MSDLVRDRLWIWGHPGKCFDDKYLAKCGKKRKKDAVEPASGMRDLGAKNIFYVPFNNPMDIVSDSKDTEGVAKTGISIEKWGEAGVNRLEKSLEIAKLFSKTCDRMVFDDFFADSKEKSSWLLYSIEDIRAVREGLHALGYEMWIVLYQQQIDVPAAAFQGQPPNGKSSEETRTKAPVQDYLNEFDGISFWFWNEPSVEQYLTYTARFLEMTKGKKRMIGCYLWNFGLLADAVPELVRYQLDSNLALIRAGELDGIILHNNALGAYGLPAYEAAKAWVAKHGDEEI